MLPAFLADFTNHSESIAFHVDQFVGFVVTERFTPAQAMYRLKKASFTAPVVANDKIEAWTGLYIDFSKISESVNL
jgi:hypothetical protein